MDGQAFMFTPDGVVSISQDGTPLEVVGANASRDEEYGAFVPRRAHTAERSVTAIHRDSQPQSISGPAATLRPADVVRAAKARTRDIRAELRNMKRLEKELGELERLIAAAKQKPVAVVRNIDHARRAR